MIELIKEIEKGRTPGSWDATSRWDNKWKFRLQNPDGTFKEGDARFITIAPKMAKMLVALDGLDMGKIKVPQAFWASLEANEGLEILEKIKKKIIEEITK